ncbi:MAG: hypothetical protein R3Y68_02230 [Rikenellaceae bacterium]
MTIDKYDEWVKITPIEDMISGFNPTTLNATEIDIIRELAPPKICDIGCLNGSRLFPFLESEGIKFVGIEKYSKLAEGDDRRYVDNIIIEDILNITNISYAKSLEDIDMITILGGSLYGVFGYDNQFTAWENIRALLRPCGKVIYDSFIIDGYFDEAEIGVIQYRDCLPPQFYLTEKQLLRLWADIGFNVNKYVDYEMNDWKYGARRYYILSLK